MWSLFRRGSDDLTDDPVVEIERWFIRRGVPHFIDRYNARDDIFTRASPLLSFWFLIAMSGFSPFNTATDNALNLVAGIAILLGLLFVSNRRSGRPLLSFPSRIGAPSLTIFVVLPALVPLIGSFDPVDGLVILVIQIVVLAVIYLGTSYAVLPLTYWAIRSLFEQLSSIFGLFTRALPLLMLITIVMFISSETWQATSAVSTTAYLATMALFALAGLVFLLGRLPREISSLTGPLDWEQSTGLAQTTPVAGIILMMDDLPGDTPPLSRNQRWNVGLVLLVRQCLQVLLVTLLISLFFLLFGKLFITSEVVETWTGTAPANGIDLNLPGVSLAISRQLALVAGFVSAFSGLYFAVYASTDSTYRQEFNDDIVEEVRRALVVRAIYLSLLENGSPDPASLGSPPAALAGGQLKET